MVGTSPNSTPGSIVVKPGLHLLPCLVTWVPIWRVPGKYGKTFELWNRIVVQKLSYRFSTTLVSFSCVPRGNISTRLTVLPAYNTASFGV